MHRYLWIATLVLSCSVMAAEEAVPAATVAQQAPSVLQESFNRKYKDFLHADSQMLLPFPQLETQAWKQILESRPLRKIYTEPGKYYNSKVYGFTLYQAADDGSYYLEAKGGFWGMDELAYGPLTEKELR